MIGLAPLLLARLSAPSFHSLIAVDASSSGLGVVASKSDTRGGESVEELVQQRDWSVILASRWRRDEHINVLELRAVHTAVRWALSYPLTFGCRIRILSDSKVTIGCVSKGRSSSASLLRRMRCLSASLLAAGVGVDLQYVPSALNPADEPSRRFQNKS